MSRVRIVLEAAKGVHPMAVHAYPSEKGKFTVHATGSKVQHVKKGDTVSSSDLDDLSDAGHKVKEVKKPLSESTTAKKKVAEGYKRDSGYGHAADAHYKTLSPKMQDAVNLHLRKGKSYDDAVKAAKVHVKEEEELEEAGMPASVIKHKEKLSGMSDKDLAHHLGDKSKKDLRDMAARHGYGWNKQTKTGSDHYVKRVAAGKKDLGEGKEGSGGYRMKDGTYVPYKSYERAGQEVRAKRAEAGRALADANKKTRANVKEEQIDELKAATLQSYADKRQAGLPKRVERGSKEHKQMQMIGKARDKAAEKLHRGGHMTPSMAREEVEQVDEKLTPEAKSAVKQALGPKTPGNQMRKGSSAARTLISVLKSNKKNVVPGTK